MKVLAKITLEEADDIIQLIEKKNALNNFCLLYTSRLYQSGRMQQPTGYGQVKTCMAGI